MSNGEAMKPERVDESLTVPCEGIGVWEGARVVYRPTLDYCDSQQQPGAAGIVTCVRERAGHLWADVAFGRHIERHPATCLHLDLTHRMTRLEAMARLAERMLGRTVYHARFQRIIFDEVWGYGLGFESDSGTGSLGAWQPDLDPTDRTRLEDGALWVDVEALAFVLREVFVLRVVFGREVKP